MEEELDLRSIGQSLARQWRIILAVALAVLIVGMLFAFLRPPVYEASAIVAIVTPEKEVPFGTTASRAYALLAKDKDLEARVLNELGWSISLETLDSRLGLRTDSGVIQLTASDRNPEKAAQLANTWAGLYVQHLNDIFNLSDPDLVILQQQVEDSQAALIDAQKALADFQSQSQITSLQTQLNAAATALSERLNVTDRLKMLAGDARSLKGRLESENTTATAAASEFQALIMEAMAISPQADLPFQIQVNLGSDSPVSTTALVQNLAQFAQAVEGRATEITQEAEGLPATISALQADLQKQQNELDRLMAAYDVAKSSYKSSMQRLDDEKTTLALKRPTANSVGQAVAPIEPASLKPEFVIALALIGGLLIGGVAALIADQLRRQPS